MKKFPVVVSVAAACLCLVAPHGWAQELNILFFGNSFTIGSDLSGKVGKLAVADGYPLPNIVADLESGANLDYHLNQLATNPNNNVNHASMGVGDTWDYVVIQGYSTDPTHIGNVPDFISDVLALYQNVFNHVSGHGAGAKAILFETWARHPTNTDFYPTPFSNAAAMQSELRTSYESALQNVLTAQGAGSARLARVGDGFEDLNFDISLYISDLYHPSAKGSLLGSMIIYRSIYGEDLSDISYSSVSSWAGVNFATWNQLVAIADAFPAPEPGTVTVMGAAAAALLKRRRRQPST